MSKRFALYGITVSIAWHGVMECYGIFCLLWNHCFHRSSEHCETPGDTGDSNMTSLVLELRLIDELSIIWASRKYRSESLTHQSMLVAMDWCEVWKYTCTFTSMGGREGGAGIGSGL